MPTKPGPTPALGSADIWPSIMADAHIHLLTGKLRIRSTSNSRRQFPSRHKQRRKPLNNRHKTVQTNRASSDKTCRIEVELTVEPVLTTLQKIGAFLLQCMCGLFLNVQPRFRSQTSSPLRPMETARSSASRRTISLSVTSFASSIIPTM